MTKTKKNPNGKVPETVAKNPREDKPKSMRLTPETRKRLTDAKYIIGVRTWDEVVNFLIDDSETVQLHDTGFCNHSEEAREMRMLTSKMEDLFKLSWGLSSDAEARVTQEMKAIIAEKDDTIATLKNQLEEDATTHAELQKCIEKLKLDLDMMRRERDAAQLRADTLAQANELSELIKTMQSAAKTAGAADASNSGVEGDEPTEADEAELSPEDEDTLDQYDSRYTIADDEPPF